MTVKTQVDKVTMPGNGVAIRHPFSPMVIFKETDLSVVHVDAAGAETPLTLGTGPTNYAVEVARYPGTGNVVYPADESTPLPTGEKLVTKRVLILEQQVELETQGAYDPKVQEGMHDRGTMIDIQQQESIDRSIKVPVSYTGPPIELPVPEANHLIGWDEELRLKNFNIAAIPGLEVTPWSIAWNKLTSSVEGRATLQVPWTVSNAGPPGPTNDETAGHKALDLWLDSAGAEWYVCMDATAANAVWTPLWQQLTTLRAYDFALSWARGVEVSVSEKRFGPPAPVVRSVTLPQNLVGSFAKLSLNTHSEPFDAYVYATNSGGWGSLAKLCRVNFAAGASTGTFSEIHPNLVAGDVQFTSGADYFVTQDDDDTLSKMVDGQAATIVLKGVVS